MRIIKDAEERRNEILDIADILFQEKGFDKSTTNDIIEKANIARGTLYYHFKSKEAIMDALIERYTMQVLSAAKIIADDKTIPIHERITRSILALRITGKGATELTEHMHKPQNALLHQKMQSSLINTFPSILVSIIEEGIEQGVFQTPYPYECLEMVVTYATTIFDSSIVTLTQDEFLSRVNALVFNIERLLGTETGSLSYFFEIFASKNT